MGFTKQFEVSLRTARKAQDVIKDNNMLNYILDATSTNTWEVDTNEFDTWEDMMEFCDEVNLIFHDNEIEFDIKTVACEEGFEISMEEGA